MWNHWTDPQIDGRRGYANKAHIQEQRVYRKDLVHTVPTEAAGASSVPFTTQEEGQEKENVAEEKTEEVKVEPFTIEEETHKQLEELKTRQPAEVRPCKADLELAFFPTV